MPTVVRFTLILLLFIAAPVFSQKKFSGTDTVFLMNGQVIGQKVIDTLLGAVSISHPTKPWKKIHFEWDQLYMVKFANGKKRYYYYQDPELNNWFTRQEMWMYMKGENDARKGFKAKGAFRGGFALGLLGGMTGTFWAPIAPFGYMALSGLPRIRIRHNTISNPKYIESDAYILGYERVARQRRRIRSLLGGTIGLAAGFAFYGLFNSHYPESLNIGFGN